MSTSIESLEEDMSEAKTSTFVVHHDRCDPASWTPDNVLALSRFITSGGDIRYAAALSRLGVQLVTSEEYVPKGGDMAQVGWSLSEWQKDGAGEYVEIVEDLDIDADVTPVLPIYAGPLKYAVQMPIGNLDGEFEGYEIEIKESEQEAEALAASFRAES
jgi:hypothetical protein